MPTSIEHPRQLTSDEILPEFCARADSTHAKMAMREDAAAAPLTQRPKLETPCVTSPPSVVSLSVDLVHRVLIGERYAG